MPLASGVCCHHLQVDKYDDPNTAVNKLMLALTGMGFDLNFPANRLKQASLPRCSPVLAHPSFLAGREGTMRKAYVLAWCSPHQQ